MKIGTTFDPEISEQAQERSWKYITAIMEELESINLTKGQEDLKRFFRRFNINPKWIQSNNKEKMGFIIDSLIGKNQNDLRV